MAAPAIVAVPLAGGVTALIESASPSGSLSLASTLIVTGVLNAVVAASSTATGARFGRAATNTLTLAVAVPPWPSSIVYVKRAMPENPAVGVKVSVLPLIATLPPTGCVTLAIVSALPSGSVSFAEHVDRDRPAECRARSVVDGSRRTVRLRGNADRDIRARRAAMAIADRVAERVGAAESECGRVHDRRAGDRGDAVRRRGHRGHDQRIAVGIAVVGEHGIVADVPSVTRRRIVLRDREVIRVLLRLRASW